MSLQIVHFHASQYLQLYKQKMIIVRKSDVTQVEHQAVQLRGKQWKAACLVHHARYEKQKGVKYEE